jgi:DNA-binding transcriptional regulator YhcF (GntR family)
MVWQFSADAPIYSQIVEQIKAQIASGELSAGERLPPVRELAVSAGVNPNTMQRALSELERDGLVYTQRTSGRFVTEDNTMIDKIKNDIASTQISEFLAAMKRLGYDRSEIIRLIENSKEES